MGWQQFDTPLPALDHTRACGWLWAKPVAWLDTTLLVC